MNLEMFCVSIYESFNVVDHPLGERLVMVTPFSGLFVWEARSSAAPPCAIFSLS